MVTTFVVYVASEAKANGELDFYSILGLDPSADKSKVKKQYKKMAVLLHPDKNRTVGADGAFRLVSEAWTLLSDTVTAIKGGICLLGTMLGLALMTIYVNKRLSCKNCRGVFKAVETGLAPINGAFPYSNYSYMPENGYASHGCGGSYVPKTMYHAPTGPTGHHSGHKPVSNISFQGNVSVDSVEVIDHNGLSTSSFVFYQANGDAGRTNVSASKHASRLCSPPETSSRRCSAAPAFDTRQLLIERARSEIRGNLEPMRLTSEDAAAAEAEKRNALATVDKSTEAAKLSQPELKRSASVSITVPDSDFHDFYKDRSEESFRIKQIWALYDEEDGMPHLYCLIREVISLNPFKIYISYLSSKSDSEFGAVNWLDSGFTKSCGNFRVFHSETVEQVNIFSHLLVKEKAGRGGCVRIYSRCGDIWAVYRNWSPDWNRTTPDEERHQYEMVEVLGDYCEEEGVWVTLLVKLDAYKTVYQRNANTSAIRCIPRREMLRFSHQVPSCLLNVQGTSNLPQGCWDLDPAAIPDELLRRETEPEKNANAQPTPTECITSMEVFLERVTSDEGEYVIQGVAPTKTIAKVLEELS
ncbi:hypothetical protein SASPL_113013 [Salvia splendens]|uniref:J domain-containing protein n=1 Tax=Salvia splendens TaxID=180675 RepID=A0A8X8ZZV5_SALSN|nr:hypothetical protein SASPL_113013 [Salvia splendens]